MQRHVLFAVLFSFVIPGLGQIYNEDLGKGALFIAGSLLAFFFFGLGYVILWLWAMIDAYVRARNLQYRA